MPASVVDMIEAFIFSELAVGVIQACKLKGNNKILRATKDTYACSGEVFKEKRGHLLSVLY